jgi:DNA-binding NarL/FixJ family response regulator
MKRIRVLLADDHTMVVEGLRRLLEPEFDLVGTVEDGRALVREAERLRPDVALVDIAMPQLNGLEAARKITAMNLGVKIVFLTMHADATYVSEAFRSGASGYLLKRSAASELPRAIRTVVEGKNYVAPSVTPEVSPSGVSWKQRGSLTPRQREVLQLVAEGRAAKEIAAALRISVKTVEFHKSGIMQRLGIYSTAELTRYALDHGIAGV